MKREEEPPSLDGQDPSPCPTCPNRRTFLKISGGLVTLAGAGGLSACGDEDDLDVLTSDMTISLAEHSALADQGQTAFIVAGLVCPIAVTRTGADAFAVTGTECNHQHCCVDRASDGWLCPCHGSAFELNGALKNGPATGPLTVYDYTVNGDTLTILAP